MDTFERIQRLRDDYESALDEAGRARDQYHRAIVKLHRSGMSLREIAEGLGISHQRVHQIVSPHEDVKSAPKARRGAIAGAVGAILLLTGGAVFLSSDHEASPQRASVRPSPSDSAIGGCSVEGGTPISSSTPLEIAAACRTNTAVVVLDPDTGDILAMLAGRGSTVSFIDLPAGPACTESGCRPPPP